MPRARPTRLLSGWQSLRSCVGTSTPTTYARGQQRAPRPNQRQPRPTDHSSYTAQSRLVTGGESVDWPAIQSRFPVCLDETHHDLRLADDAAAGTGFRGALRSQPPVRIGTCRRGAGSRFLPERDPYHGGAGIPSADQPRSAERGARVAWAVPARQVRWATRLTPRLR